MYVQSTQLAFLLSYAHFAFHLLFIMPDIDSLGTERAAHTESCKDRCNSATYEYTLHINGHTPTHMHRDLCSTKCTIFCGQFRVCLALLKLATNITGMPCITRIYIYWYLGEIFVAEKMFRIAQENKFPITCATCHIPKEINAANTFYILHTYMHAMGKGKGLCLHSWTAVSGTEMKICKEEFRSNLNSRVLLKSVSNSKKARQQTVEQTNRKQDLHSCSQQLDIREPLDDSSTKRHGDLKNVLLTEKIVFIPREVIWQLMIRVFWICGANTLPACWIV